jgi:hypothetical protein
MLKCGAAVTVVFTIGCYTCERQGISGASSNLSLNLFELALLAADVGSDDGKFVDIMGKETGLGTSIDSVPELGDFYTADGPALEFDTPTGFL